MKSKLKKNILITGTSSGIGKSIALKLLKQDYSVIGISRKHTIRDNKYIAYTQDISDLKGFSKLLDEIRKKHKNIHGIISNAGEGSFNKLENFSESEILNFFNRKGIFIFIGSEASKIGGVQGTLYTSAKHALYGFVKSFRKEANKAAVRATIINPGMVRTSFFNSLNFQPGKSKENALEASDIAELVYFLCQSSKYINFTDINVDPIKKVILKK